MRPGRSVLPADPVAGRGGVGLASAGVQEALETIFAPLPTGQLSAQHGRACRMAKACAAGAAPGLAG